MSVQYYLTKYAYILNENNGKSVKWQPWPYLLDILEILDIFDDIVLLKARQLGWSWLVSLYCEHRTHFTEASKCLFISKDEDTSWELLAKPKYMNSMLPEFLRLQEKHADNKGLMDFRSNNSLIKALSATAAGGRSSAASIAVRDELAFHPYGEESFTAIGPTIDSGGKLIDISTIDKDNLETHFSDRVNRAMRGATKKVMPSGLEVYTGGESGAVLVFGGVFLRPVRDERMTIVDWWDNVIVPKYSEYQREKEYPRSIEEALSLPKGNAFFDVEAVNDMELHLQPPLFGGEINKHNGIVRIFKPPQVGRRYVIYTDPSGGKEDPFATVVMDLATKEQVAAAGAYLPADDAAMIHDELCRAYHAFNSFEVNAQAGGTFQAKIKELGTLNCIMRRNSNGNIVKDEIGLYITPALKKKVLWDLEEAVRRRAITNHDDVAVKEFRGFIRNPDEDMPHSVKGMHDDFIMAWAGVLHVSKYVPMGEYKIESFKYKESW